MIFFDVNYCIHFVGNDKKLLEQVANSKSYEAIERIKRETA